MRYWLLRLQTLSILAGLALGSTLQAASTEGAPVVRQAATAPAGTPGINPARTPRAPQHDVRTVPARVNRVYIYPGTRTVVPPAWVRCSVAPDMGYWHQRDLMTEIKWLSRSGFIPVNPIGDSVEAISDFSQKPAGWRAYGISVPAGGTVQVEVKHLKLGWFRLMMMNKWGEPGEGMLQQRLVPHPVMLTYKNPGKVATAVYVIVDDPGWWSDATDPYTLQVRRDWDPAKTDLSQVKMVAGLWGATPSVSAEFR